MAFSKFNIQTTRAHLIDVDRRVQRVDSQLRPVLTGVAPLISTPSRRALRAGLKRSVRAVDRLPAIATDLHQADLGTTLVLVCVLMTLLGRASFDIIKGGPDRSMNHDRLDLVHCQ